MVKQIVILLTALVILFSTNPAHAQQPGKLPQIGVLFTGGKSIHGIYVDVLRRSLRDAGYVDGRDVVLDYRFGNGKRGRIRAQAAEFVRRDVDVIVAAGLPPAQEAAKLTRTIPIVVTFASDLVGSGLVASYAKPGGNVTGMTSLAVDLSAKRLQLVKEAVPSVSRVAMLFNPTAYAGVETVQRARTAAVLLGVAIQQVPVRGTSDFENAFAAMARERADALIMVVDRLIATHRRQLIGLAARRKLPTMCWRPAMARDGCLMSYGADRSAMVRRSASYVAKILRGSNPAEMPIEQPTKFGLAVNLKTAKALGITFPPSILLRATEVIE